MRLAGRNDSTGALSTQIYIQVRVDGLALSCKIALGGFHINVFDFPFSLFSFPFVAYFGLSVRFIIHACVGRWLGAQCV